MKLVSAIYGNFYPFIEMDLFKDYVVGNNNEDLDTNSCLLVHGGADISPTLYNRPVSRRTSADAQLSPRDAIEWRLMKRAKDLGIPIIGICRGAQMICALADGFLIQDVTNHGRSHGVLTMEGKEFLTNSCHHQMLNPFDVDHVMVAHTKYEVSEHYIDVKPNGQETSIPMKVEPEFVWFPKEKGVAIQWHPEWMGIDTDANKYVKEKIKELLF